MTAQDWMSGRLQRKVTQVEAAARLGVSQAYLSQLENGSRAAGAELARRAATFYGLKTALPLPEPEKAVAVDADRLVRDLAGLGYPKFAHVRAGLVRNPAAVVFGAVTHRDLDTRVVEALPWVLATYVDLDWAWLRDQVKLRNAQNRLGYAVHLAMAAARGMEDAARRVAVLERWERELEDARLAGEGTLCRDSMPERERAWVKAHRPAVAAHWNLLTTVTAESLPYARA